MKTYLVSVALAAVFPLSAGAQPQQRIVPPTAVYWMSVETAGGMGMDIPPGMGSMMPPGMAGGKLMRLELGSAESPRGEPWATHVIPPSLGMGQQLRLVTPRSERSTRRERDDEDEPEFERPQGRMLVYWGCGERIGVNQPVVFDFANMDPREASRIFRSVSISRPRGPSATRNRTYGTWPNPEDSRTVPGRASLQGEHEIFGNYSPNIRFSVDARHDFLDSVSIDPVRRLRGGAYAVRWNAVRGATGYFATAMGQGNSQNDVVFWSSSESQVMGQMLMDYIVPREVDRLIRDRVVMPPHTTECAVPAGIFRGEGAMLQFIAYGDELNVVHPPRPRDPRQTWEQEWAVKLRLKSTAMAMLEDDDSRRRSSSGRDRNQFDSPPQRDFPAQRDFPPPQRQEFPSPPPQQASPPPPSREEAIQEGVKALRGIFGF